MLGADPAEGVIQGNRFLHPDMGFGLAFPAGWEIVNTPAAVIGIPQKHNARFALEDAGTGDDPQAVAEPYLAKRLAEVQAVIEFKGMQETRCCKTYVVRGSVQTPQGVIAGQLTWVALGGRVYRLSAAYLPIVAGQYADRARQFVRSLHPLTPAGARLGPGQPARARARQGRRDDPRVLRANRERVRRPSDRDRERHLRRRAPRGRSAAQDRCARPVPTRRFRGRSARLASGVLIQRIRTTPGSPSKSASAVTRSALSRRAVT